MNTQHQMPPVYNYIIKIPLSSNMSYIILHNEKLLNNVQVETHI